MKKKFLFIIASILLFSCTEKSKLQEKVAKIPMNIELDRFDKAFFETPVSQLSSLKKQYPSFFPEETPDAVWIEKMTNPQWKELYKEVQKKYSNFDNQKEEIEDLFRHITFFYPKTRTPKVVTLIYEMDNQFKTIYADSLVLISLEMYLGENHKFYEYPKYIKSSFNSNQILPDIVQEFSVRKVKPPVEKDFLSMLIYTGKQLYLKDAFLPEYSDQDKIDYSKEQLKWCQEHESDVWRFFIEENVLYDVDPKLAQRFISPAPFSKFGLVSDNETPGRIGTWIGWQIVRSFMDNNKVSLQQLMVMDAKEIFQKSKYKPKK